MGLTPLIVHERIGTWARQLRPRVSGWLVRLVETRSASDLVAALTGSACPIGVFDLTGRTRSGLEELDQASQAAPAGLFLILDDTGRPELADLARELGASHVLPSGTPPPTVAALLARWLTLARRRAECDGWAVIPEDPRPDWLRLLGR
jgi:DNA-binding NarL/FixJ family response regulator